MTWLLRIASSFLLLWPAIAADVSGSVRISNSLVSSVRKGRNYSGVVVWLEPLRDPKPPAPPRNPRYRMEQKDKRFIPHVLAVPVGAEVGFPNLDPVFHSAFSNFSGQIFDFGLYAPGTSRTVTFTRPGIVRIFCNIHPSMSAVIVVLNFPWFALSGETGAFVIRDVPEGDYDLRVFHERATREALDSLGRRLHINGENIVLPPLMISESGYLEQPHKNKYGQDYPPGSGEDGAYPPATK